MTNQIQNKFILGITIIILGLFSCTTTQEINGFGGGFRSFGSKVEPQKNVPQKKEIKTVNPENTTETTAANEIDFENLNCTEKMEVNTITKSKLIDLKKALTTSKLTEKPKLNSFKQKILTKLSQMKLKHSRSNTKQNKGNDFFPDESSDFGYWFLFCLFSLMCLVVVGCWFSYLNTGDEYVLAAVFLFGLAALIHLLGLKNYDKLYECGFLYQFGFWTSMVGAWFFGIPLLIWIIGALTC